MKKIVALVLSLVFLAALFTACSPKGKSLEEVQKAGKLVIASSPDFPPYEELDESGNVVGIEIDIMQLIADKLGVELVIKQMAFDSVLTGIQAGKFDVGVSGITVTAKREKNMLFTDPYCVEAQVIVVEEGSAIASKADLSGKKVSVQTGTTADTFCRDNGYTVEAFKNNSDAQLALTTKKVDAWVIDGATATDMVATYNAENETKLVILDEHMTEEPYAFAFAFGSETLVEEINKILGELLADGTIKSIFDKYEAVYVAPSAK